jgi:glyoxylase-like metal-dependent hydrolase (beta-lactamase superfamily II)
MQWRVASPWFRAARIDDRLTRIDEPFVAPLLRCNIWHLRGRDRDLVVDGGLGLTSLRQAFPELLSRDIVAVATHTHVDHIGGLHEFAHRAVHLSEAHGETASAVPCSLRGDRYSPELRASLENAGYEVPEWLVSAVPFPGFDPGGFEQPAFVPTEELGEGDVVDLGDLAFEVLHLPGHSPGSLGLWQPRTRMLLSGDAVYDGPLLDTLPGSNIDDYVRTMERLQRLPAEVIHGGHDSSFGRARLVEIADRYLVREGT